MRIILVIPTYNEGENITLLVEKIFKLGLKGLSVVIVDDASPDGTGKIADKLAQKHKGFFEVIHRKGKLGLGSAYKVGIKRAIQKKADIIVSMDADLSHQPKKIPEFINKIGQNDIVIGSRHIKGGKIKGFSLWRKLLTKTAQRLCMSILGMPVHDSTSAFRAYKREVFDKIQPDSINSQGFSFLIESIYRIYQEGFNICEVPIVFRVRERGESKISTQELFKALLYLFRIKLRLI